MKGFSLLMSIAAVFAAVIAGLLFFKIEYDKEQLLANNAAVLAQLASAQQRAGDIARDHETVGTELATVQREMAELKARNTTLEARNSQLARELTRHRETLSTREQSDQNVQQELANLRKQVADSRTALATAIGGASPEQVAAYEARIKDLEAQLMTVRRDAQASTVFSSVPSTLKGEVIEVGPKSAFVVLNIGLRDGAAPALEMILRRGTKALARIRLTDVRESYSVATVLPETGTGNIRPGDVASQP